MKTIGRFSCKPFCLLIVIIMAGACQNEPGERVLPDARELQEAFAESNKHLLAMEETAIDDFIARYGWETEATGSGLRYMITQEGEGEKPIAGQQVVIDYTIYLITGDPVYSSGEEGKLEFTVGRGGVERGLEEGILMMRKGTEATFIMPHHLAHGVPGDGKRIPRRATIIYKVHLLDIY